LRRRKQKNQVRESIAKYGTPTKDYVLDRSLTPEAQLPKNGDVFAEFGGTSYFPIITVSLTSSQDDTKVPLQHHQDLLPSQEA